LATPAGLVALDPLTGAVRWRRSDVPRDCRLFHDGEHVFVVRLDPSSKVVEVKDRIKPSVTWDEQVHQVALDEVAGSAAYRLRDGAAVPVKDFSALFGKRVRILDGRLLLREAGAGKALVLRLYDVAAGKDVWRQAFLPGALPILCEDEELTGVVE